MFETQSGLGNCPPPGGGNPLSNGTIGAAAASTAVGAAVAGGVLTAASAGLLAPVAPIVGMLIGNLFTPDYCKIDASNAANEASNQMEQNLQSWQALPKTEKCSSIQAYYLQNYDNLWQALVSYCSNPQLGSAGQRCISDREPGGRWPYQTYYRDPIANDSSVLPDAECPALVGQTTSSVTSVIAKDWPTFIIPVALLALAFIL